MIEVKGGGPYSSFEERMFLEKKQFFFRLRGSNTLQAIQTFIWATRLLVLFDHGIMMFHYYQLELEYTKFVQIAMGVKHFYLNHYN